MGKEENLAARYEKRYPGTGCKSAQKAERMERMDIKEGRGKNSGFAGGSNTFMVSGFGPERTLGGYVPSDAR